MNGGHEGIDCPKCAGMGVRSVYLGGVGGYVECRLCEGTGRVGPFKKDKQ